MDTETLNCPTVTESQQNAIPTPEDDMTWNQVIQQLRSQIESQIGKSDEESNIFRHWFWKYLFDRFQKFYLNKNEQLQLLQMVTKLMKVNFGLQSVKEQLQFCEQMATKFLKLENILYFKHKQSFNYFKFMANRKLHEQMKDQLFFEDLEFNLSQQETLKIAEKVRAFCTNDLDSFAFLSLYLQISVTKMLSHENLGKVEEEYKERLNQLQNHYPPNQSQSSTDSLPQISSLKLMRVESQIQVQKFVFQNNGITHLSQLKDFVMKKADDAKKQKELFQKLVKDICYQKGYGFKCGLKINNSDNQTPIFRTMQKLVEDELKEIQSIQSVSDVVQNLISKFSGKKKPESVWKSQKLFLQLKDLSKSYSFIELRQLIQSERKLSHHRIQEVIQKKQSIVFQAFDLLRAKCTFNTMEQISETMNSLINRINFEGYEVLKLKNRLENNTKDAVLIIKLPNSIAQLQLVLKLDSVANEFNHKIYQLKRSKLYAPITNLFVQNQKWSEKFFSGQFEMFENVISLEDNFQFDQKYKFNSFVEDCRKFKTQFLQSYLIEYQKNKKLVELQKKQITNGLNHLKQIVSKRQYSNVDSLKRIKFNRIYEIKFVKNLYDYKLALKMIDQIKSSQIQVMARVYNTKGDIFYSQRQYEQSQKHYLDTIKLYQEQDQNQLQYAHCLNGIAGVYVFKKKHQLAIENFRQALNIVQKVKGKQSQEAASYTKDLGYGYQQKGDLDKALQFYQEVLNIYTKIKGEDSIEVAETLNRLGIAYSSKQDYIKSLEYYEKSLDIKIKSRGKYSIDVASTKYNIGRIYRDLKQFDKAIQHFKTCLDIQTKVRGKHSIQNSISFQSLSYAYIGKEQYEQALKYRQKSLSIIIKIKGEASKEVADEYQEIGEIHEKVLNYQKSIEAYKKSLEIKIKIYGQDSQEIFLNNRNIAIAYQELKIIESARQYYEKALNIKIKHFGNDSIELYSICNWIAVFYRDNGFYQKAIFYYEWCLQVETKNNGPETQDASFILRGIALTYTYQGNFVKAEKYNQDAMKIRFEKCGQQSEQVAQINHNWSLLYEKMGLIEKSFELVSKAYQVRKKVLGDQHEQTKLSFNQLQKMENLFLTNKQSQECQTNSQSSQNEIGDSVQIQRTESSPC